MLGRVDLVLQIFFPKFKNEFEVAILGLKGGQSWRRFRQENFENTNFSKTRQTPLGPREKLLGRAGLVLQIFFPESENYFEYGFLGGKVGDFPSEMGFRSRGQPEKPEIDEGVPGFGRPERI